MQPLLHPGDLVLVRRRRPSHPFVRGEIVVITVRGETQVKRVIGLPGERITFAEGRLFIDGENQRETYLRGLPPYLGLEESEYDLGRDQYFLMGDNRTRSTDSRHYGPVHRTSIEGRAVCRVWPPSRWGRL